MKCIKSLLGALDSSKLGSASKALSTASLEYYANFAYYFAFALYATSRFLSYTTFETMLFLPKDTFADALQAIALVLLVVKFVLQRVPLHGWFIATTIVLVGFASWQQAAEGWLFWLVLFVVCSEGISIKALAGTTFVIVAVLTPLTMFCGSLGIIENRISVRAGVYRQALGFTHPNNLGYFVLLLSTSFSVMRWGERPIPDIILILLTLPVNLLIANSRSSAALSLFQIALLLVFWLVRNPKARRLVSVGCVAVVAMVVAFSYWSLVFYNASDAIMRALDTALTGRLNLAHAYYQVQGLTLFGSDYSQANLVFWESGKPYTFVVDNAFCHLLLRYGIVPTALFLAGLFSLLAKLLHERRWDSILFGLTLMSVYGFCETLGIQVECDFFLVSMGTELLFGQSGLLCGKRSIVGRES